MEGQSLIPQDQPLATPEETGDAVFLDASPARSDNIRGVDAAGAANGAAADTGVVVGGGGGAGGGVGERGVVASA